jgi:hypothetical protein
MIDLTLLWSVAARQQRKPIPQQLREPPDASATVQLEVGRAVAHERVRALLGGISHSEEDAAPAIRPREARGVADPR